MTRFGTSAITVIACGLILACSFTKVAGQNAFDRGQNFYNQRGAKTDSFQVDPGNINKAIQAFQKALDQGINPKASTAFLLKSYYFKGMFTGISTDQQKEVYDKGRDLGEKAIKQFPDSVPIKFWYGANIGRWADLHGFVQSATNGIAKKLRRICHQIIKLDPQYQGGGGYRILAQVHFYAPHIPILMSWPSNDKALDLIQKALKIAPNHPTNRMLYAQILLKFDRKDEAKKQLQYILDMTPRPTHKVEDRYIQHHSRELLKEHF